MTKGAGTRSLLLLLAAATSVVACAPRTARLYTTDTASPPITMHYKGGQVWIGERAAPTCTGEYRTSSTTALNGNRGLAVLNCQDGRVFNCDFEFSEWTGAGAGTCVDNQQQKYRSCSDRLRFRDGERQKMRETRPRAEP